MAKITLEEQPEFLTFPAESILDLKIEECNIRTVQGNRGDWQKVECKFKILGIQALGDGSPKEPYDVMITQYIYGSVPFRLTDSPDNRLRQWAEAIFNMELGLGFELDTDAFVGRQCRGITSTYQGKNGIKHQIDSLLPKSGGGLPGGIPANAGAVSAAPATGPANDPWGDNWGGDEPPF